MNIKGLVLGAAAGAIAVTGAQAADLPVVEPVDFVRICDAYGAGYYFIPGTETCLRVSGRIRTDFNVFTDIDDSDFSILGGYAADGSNGYRFRARGYLYMDSRTSTEFGLLRTFMELNVTTNFGGDGGDTSGGINLNRAFIQFGGLTFGRTGSFFNAPFFGTTQAFDPAFPDNTTNVLAYTAAFGNGFSASIALEDSSYVNNGITFNAATFPVGGPRPTQQGTRLPNLVGSLTVEQGWGSASLNGVLRYVEEFVISNDTEIGFAVGANVSVNVPFGNSTTVGLSGTYGQGATAYVATGFSGGFIGRNNQDADAVVDVNGNLQTSEAYAISGGISTSLTPTVSFDGRLGYAAIDHANIGFDADASFIDAEGFVGWSPVSGFVIGVGAQYRYEDAGALGQGDAIAGFLRAQRTF